MIEWPLLAETAEKRPIAWPAAKEQRIEACVEATVGVGLLVWALARGDARPLVWAAIFAVVAVAALYPRRWQRRKLESAQPAPAGTAAPSWRWLVRFPLVVASAAMTAILAWILPETAGFVGAAILAAAVPNAVRASVIARFERERGVRVLRIRAGAFEERWVLEPAH
jgi:hypothetical protein